ncbi:MAG TPA: hypothetical protein VLL75_22050, partial [Vicinamibacteria bacterium]|nr:hypothetical protein [Vicinamibacteria bacterium]
LGFGESLDAPYNLLAQALGRGQLHLLVEPSPELFRLADPYEPGRNASVRLHDASLYRGRYYYYFGVVPAAVAFVPWRLVGLGDLPEAAAAVAFGLGGFLFSALVLLRLLGAHLARPRAPLLFSAFVSLGVFNLLPFLLRSPEVYEVAIAAGLLFSTAAAYFFLRAGDGGGLGSLALGGACLGLAVGCRPNLIVLAAALPLLSARGAGSGAAVRPDGGRGRRVWREVLAVAVPLALVLVPLALYNHARFGSWTEFGASYQLIGARRISWLDFRASPYVLYYLFLAPFSFRGDFPHLVPYHDSPFGTPAPEGLFADPSTTGVLVQAPFLLILAATPLVLRHSPVRDAPLLRRRLRVLVGAGLLLPVATSLVFASVAMRFAADFLTLLLVPALFLWLALAASDLARRWRVALAVALVFSWSFTVALTLSLTGRQDDLRRRNPALHRALERRVEPLRVVVGRLLDRGGRARVRARVALPERFAAGTEPLLSWGTADEYDVLWLRPSGPEAFDLVLDTAASRELRGAPLPAATLRAEVGPFHDLDIDLDRVRRRVRVRLGGGPTIEIPGRLVGLHPNRIWPGRGPRGHGAPEMPLFSGTLVPEAMWLAGPPGLEDLPPVAAAPALAFGEGETPPARGETGQLRVKTGASGAEIFTGAAWRWVPRSFVDRLQVSRRLEPGAAGAWEPLLVSGVENAADGVFVRRVGDRLAIRVARWDGSWQTWAEGRSQGSTAAGLATVTLDRVVGAVTVSLGGRQVLRAEADLLPIAPARIRLAALPAGLTPPPSR